MNNKGYKQWLKNFFGTSCGIENVDITPYIDSKEWQDTYQKHFIEPIMHVYNYSSPDEITTDNMTQFLCLMNNGKLKCWIYVLREVFYNYYKHSNDIRNSVNAAINSFLKDATAYYAGSARGKDYIRYVYDGCDEMIGLSARTVTCIGPVRDYPVTPNNIQVLAKKDPWLLRDNEVEALRYCCELFEGEDRLDPKKLSSTIRPVFDKDGNVVDKVVTALSRELPPYSIRDIITNMSPAYIVNEGGPYKAAYNYIMSNKGRFSVEAVDYINRHVSGDAFLVSSLDPNAILKYINDRYATEFASLDDVVYQNSKPTYGMYSYDVDEKGNEPDIEDVVNNHNNDGEWYGTFDELVVQYCTENDVDLNCTINQLLDALATETLCQPKQFIDHLTEYCEEYDLDGDTTVDELLQGIEHVPVSNKDITLKYIDRCTQLSDSAKAAFTVAIRDNQYFDIPSKKTVISDYLANVEGLPEDLVQELYNNVNDGTEIHFTSKPAVADSSDKAYVVSEYLARNMRAILDEGADFKRRDGAVPIVYAFLRILMAPSSKESDFQDLIPVLESKAKECSPEFAEIVNGAVELIKQK